MDSEVQVPARTPKRIVLWQRAGTLAGLWHIIGTDAEFPDTPPDYVDGVAYPDGHSSSADLLKTTPRAHVYQERV